jgi:hypothetical protein
MSKPKVIKDFDKLDEGIQERIRENYPDGFDKHLIKFVNVEGKTVSALPFETEDRYYLVRMTLKEARQLSENEDEDFDPDAISAEIKDEFKDNFGADDVEDEKDDFDDKDDYDDDDQDEDDKDNDDY